MSGRPELFREREGKKVLALAKKVGAKAVEFEYDGVKATIRLDESPTSAEMAAESDEQITL
jgi:hypothetical protein